MSTLFDPSDTHRSLRDMVRRFAEAEVAPGAAERDRAERFDRGLIERLGALGLLGITAPEDRGGAGLDATAAVIVHEELGWADAGMALAYLSHAILFVNGLARSTPSGGEATLAAALTGSRIGAVAMSEPGAGTDLLGMRTRAVADGDDFVIDGTKLWITNGHLGDGQPADAVLVYAKTREQGPRALSCFLVEAGTPGYALARPVTDKLGTRAAPCAELQFNACRLTRAHLLGAEGAGLIQIFRTLEIERITLAAIALGIAARAFEIMNAYASDRHAEGRPIREFGQIQTHIAESYAALMAARAHVYAAAAEIDLDRPGPGLGADSAKLTAAHTATDIADRAIQVLGGNGYIADYTVERLWRDARLLGIGGGTNEALQKNLTRNLVRLSGRVTQ